MTNKERIHRSIESIADEIYDYIKETEEKVEDGWVPATEIKQQLGLDFRAVPREKGQSGSTGWLFSIVARILEDQGRVNYKMVGRLAFYKTNPSMSEYQFTAADQAKLYNEITKYFRLANLTVAPLFFAISGTFVSLVQQSFFFNVMLFVFLSAFSFYVYEIGFPPTIKGLRVKKDKTVRERAIHKFIEAESLGWKTLLRHAYPFLVSVLFMTFVAGGGVQTVLS